jgi:signal peptidase II
MNNYLLKNRYSKNIAWLLVMAMFFIGDRILKQLALKQEYGQSMAILGDWLQFRLIFNPNIAFSLPLSGTILNILITVIIGGLTSLIIYLILNKKAQISLIWPLTFILFGAISNLLDRLSYGAVIDYFGLKYFTVFNSADLMISIGVLILIFKKERKSDD